MRAFYSKFIVVVFFQAFTINFVNSQPGENYFQQEVNYKINVKLNDVDHTLSGYEEIQYINNSPHTFRHLYFHIWPNAYKNKETALAKQLLESGEVKFHYAKESEKGYIDSLFFRVDGDSVGWKYDEKHIDIVKFI
jgi:hypothetical protein